MSDRYKHTGTAAVIILTLLLSISCATVMWDAGPYTGDHGTFSIRARDAEDDLTMVAIDFVNTADETFIFTPDLIEGIQVISWPEWMLYKNMPRGEFSLTFDSGGPHFDGHLIQNIHIETGYLEDERMIPPGQSYRFHFYTPDNLRYSQMKIDGVPIQL